MGLGLDNPSHIAIIVVVLLLVFGARRLPEIGRSLGTGIREFKGAITGEHEKAEPPAPGPSIASGPPVAERAPADSPGSDASEQHEQAATPTA
jgi:sec-independent protein translocase protein TatA